MSFYLFDMSTKTQSIKKQDLIDVVAQATGLTKTQTKTAIDSVFASIESYLSSGHAVPINNFGKFAPIQRKARKGVNPSNGKPISISASVGISFKASSSLKETLNKKKK